MPLIERNNIIEGTLGTYTSAGAPSNGTNEVQTLTFGGTWADGDTFKLAFGGQITAAIAWSATNATLVSNIDAALEALGTIGTGGVTTAVGTMTSGIGTITETFGGNLAALAVPLIAVDSKVTASGTLAVAETTPGVTATGRGGAKGAKCIDTTNGIDYINTGTSLAPTWTKTGTQS